MLTVNFFFGSTTLLLKSHRNVRKFLFSFYLIFIEKWKNNFYLLFSINKTQLYSTAENLERAHR